MKQRKSITPGASWILAFVAVLAVSASARRASAQVQFEQWPAELQTEITSIYRTFTGEVAMYVKDLSSGVRYTHNSATPMYIASGVKLAVMVEVFRQIEQKSLSLDEELIYSATDVRDGAPVLGYQRIGSPVTIRFLVDAMIRKSDNAATDMIMRRIGVPNVSKGLSSEGIFGFGQITTLLDVRKLVYQELDRRVLELAPVDFMNIGVAENIEARLARLAETLKLPPGTFSPADLERAFRAYYATGLNTAPLDAMGVLLERLAKGKLVSAEASKQMLEIMLRTETGKNRVRAGLPAHIPFAHKTGTQYRRICDFGIFFLTPKRPVVLAICVKGGQTRRRAEEVIAFAAQRTYNLMLPEEERTPAAEVLFPLDGVDAPDGEDLGEASAPPPPALKRPKKVVTKAKPKH